MAGSLILEFIQKRDRLNSFAFKLAGVHVYGPIEMPTPSVDNAELGFLRCVAWLYIHIREAGAISIRFLVGLFDGYGIDATQELRRHPSSLGDLRTELQHNILAGKQSSYRTQKRCGEWYLRSCGTRSPSNQSEWERALKCLLQEAISFVDCLDNCLRCIEKDETCVTQIDTWRNRVSRHHDPNEFDAVIQEVANDIGRDELDVSVFRNRHVARWQVSLEGCAEGYDFRREARRLIEASLLQDRTVLLPITGTEVMRFFNFAPGPEIGQLLRRALDLYNMRPCDGEALLQRLREDVERGDPEEIL